MGKLTQDAIDAAFSESLTKLLIAHNTMVMTGDNTSSHYATLLKSYKALRDERATVLALFTSV